MEKVCAVRTPSYDPALLLKAVRTHFEQLAVRAQLKPTDHVLIKPNLLMKRRPEQATTTHCLLVEAVILCLKECGITNITIADSPGGPYTKLALAGIYQATGMEQVAQRQQVTLNQDFSEVEVPAAANAEKVKHFNLLTPVVNADYVINIGKLKTHSMTVLSGGVKNLFGTIPGLQKPEFHYRFPQPTDFCNMLVDLCETVKPDLTILDAVVSMEGEGPSAGNPKQTGMTFASRSPYALDMVACDFIKQEQKQVLTLQHAIRRGLCPKNSALIAVVGDSYEPVLDFKKAPVKQVDFTGHMPKPIGVLVNKAVRPFLVPKPKVNKSICIGCGKCAQSCPAHTIQIQNQKAVIHYDACIHCFCCHEMCPVKAIAISSFRLWHN